MTTLMSVYTEAMPDFPEPSDLLRCFEQDDFVVLLESGTRTGRSDTRYSFLTADPVDVCVISRCGYGDDPFAVLRAWRNRLPSPTAGDLPPFHGGIAGLMSFELGEAFERLPRPAVNHFTTPALAAGLFDWCLVWDHQNATVQWYVIRLDGHGAEEMVRQRNRMGWLRSRLSTLGAPAEIPSDADPNPSAGEQPGIEQDETDSVDLPIGVRSNFSRPGYLAAVERVLDYIRDGDIFQANLSQQLTASWPGTAAELYRALRVRNPAPFCGLLQTSDFAVVSASPERFLRVRASRYVETRPIKGTRRRLRSPIADLFTSDELVASDKDRAENVMIVDLLRNDISRVCRIGSVRVTGVCELELFETVQHLVSTVVGELRDDRDVWDLCAACFPGGSITGAPKIRAMEIIAELERTARGAYCGSLFCFGPAGDFDSSILIRTFTLKSGRCRFPVGGGIVADSCPQSEYDETLHKASGLVATLRAAALADLPRSG